MNLPADHTPITVELIGGPLCGAITEWPVCEYKKPRTFAYCLGRCHADYLHTTPFKALFIPGTIRHLPANQWPANKN